MVLFHSQKRRHESQLVSRGATCGCFKKKYFGTRSNASQTVCALPGDADKDQEHDNLPSRVALDGEHVQTLLNQLDNYDN